ncbi:MAG: adenylyltransferase/cytidyltransferase family protein [Candidatus Pacebacteria bacterium]|nr:adenylyltransferase/cytidyltransferase family protein [Candidatus Paceibacterota bacterium]
MESGEVQKKKIVVAVSGGFDPIHIGHVRMFEHAKALGDELVVILNNDNWLRKKKGYAFMAEAERKEVIEGLRAVDRVVLTAHGAEPEDMSVAEALRELRPDVFANGGDRKQENTPEGDVCAELGIEMAFNVGHGGKVQSSSWLLKKYHENGGKDPGATPDSQKATSAS